MRQKYSRQKYFKTKTDKNILKQNFIFKTKAARDKNILRQKEFETKIF